MVAGAVLNVRFGVIFYATMPRFSIPADDKVSQARALLATYLAQPGRSEMDLSRQSGVRQYTISRFLTGRTKSLTPDVRKFLGYAENGIGMSIEKLTSDPRVQRALGSAWDGSEQGISLIADTIAALAPVLKGSRQK
jgi:hypothetical protein